MDNARYLRCPKTLAFVMLVIAAGACSGLQPEQRVKEFEVVFDRGESTLASIEIKKFSAAFEELRQHGWCVKKALALGSTAHVEAATDAQREALASRRSTYLKKVLVFFEPLDSRTYAESKLAPPSEAIAPGLTTVTIIGYRC